MNNKIKLLVFAAILSMGLTACNGGNKNKESSSDTGDVTETGSTEETSTSETETGTDTSTTEEEPPEEENPNITYIETVTTGGESDLTNNKGKLLLWFGYNCGGTVTNVSFTNENQLSIDYTNEKEWYGVQMFYALPYGELNDELTISFDVIASVSGQFTFNNKIYSLDANQKLSINETKKIEGVNLTVISIQLGTNAPSLLPSGNIKFTQPVIKDTKNTYYKVEFMAGEEVEKSIYVKENRTVSAPKDPKAPAGKLFYGWVTKDNVDYSPSALITKAMTYHAKFIDESEAVKYSVVIKNGEETIDTLEVIKGQSVNKALVKCPWAYTLRNLYKDAGKANLYNGEAVTADLTLYADLIVTPDRTWMNAEGGMAIPDQHFEWDKEGTLHFKDMNPWASNDAWAVQVNFVVPRGESGKQYRITFDYKINLAGGDVQIWDAGTQQSYGMQDLSVAEGFTTGTIEFNGGTLTENNNNMTFEFGKIAGSTTIDFYLKNVRLSEVR